MNFKDWLESYRYLGQCDRLRMCGDEDSWKGMMSQKQPISKEEFIAMCDMSALLDPDETADSFIDNHIAADPSGTGFYTSVWGDTPCSFMQTHGFEFIFVP